MFIALNQSERTMVSDWARRCGLMSDDGGLYNGEACRVLVTVGILGSVQGMTARQIAEYALAANRPIVSSQFGRRLSVALSQIHENTQREGSMGVFDCEASFGDWHKAQMRRICERNPKYRMAGDRYNDAGVAADLTRLGLRHKWTVEIGTLYADRMRIVRRAMKKLEAQAAEVIRRVFEASGKEAVAARLAAHATQPQQ